MRTKLYTEEEIKRLLKKQIIFDDDDFNKLTPIELPSDEEIVAKSKQEPYNSDIKTASRIGYVAGAKWMRDKIGGNNEPK